MEQPWRSLLDLAWTETWLVKSLCVRALPAARPAQGPAHRFVVGYGEYSGARHFPRF